MLKEKKYISIIAIISVLLSLYFCEGYLSFLNYKKSLGYKIKVYKKKTGKIYDTRTKIDFYNDEKKNKEVTLTYIPKLLLNGKQDQFGNVDFFPLSGVSNKQTIFCNEEGYYASYVSDRYGFNNPDKVWSEDDIDTIIIGDSFVHGMCVNRPNDITSVIRNLTKKNIINLGYSANGPLIEYATLREYLYKPIKNLIWIYYENDLIDLQEELESQILKKYINDDNFSQNLLSKQKEINLLNEKIFFIEEKIYNKALQIEVDTVIQSKKSLKLKNKILKFIRLNNVKKLLIYKFEPKFEPSSTNLIDENKLPYTEFKKIIENVKRIALENNINLYFVYLPRNSYALNLDNTQHKKIIKIIKEMDVSLIDLHKDFFKKTNNPQKYFTFDEGTHLNTIGYREVSKFIYQVVYN